MMDTQPSCFCLVLPASACKQGRGKGRKSTAGGGRGGGRGSSTRSKAGGAAGGGKTLQPHEASRLGVVQRDQGLELFHALGKFLYNKRDGATQAAGEDAAGAGATGSGASAGSSDAGSAAARKTKAGGSAALASQHLQPSGSPDGTPTPQLQMAGWRCDFSYTEGMLPPQ
jgi:hypothetical protein